jgi:ABC-type phosphate/phosphonate transport system substrate-binding protein
MPSIRLLIGAFSMVLMLTGSAMAADPSWPKELTFALLSTESAPEVGRRWTPILEQLGKDLGLPIKQVAATDYRGSMEMAIDPQEYFSKLTFSGSHEASILAVANKKVDVASTNLPDIQQMTREGKLPTGALRVIWVSKLIPNDPIVVRTDLPDSLKQAIQHSLTSMKASNPEAFGGGTWIGGFVKVDDAAYQIIRDLNETAKRLAALK